MDVDCGDTLYIVDPTPYHVVLVVPSTNSVLIHLPFDSRRCSFFLGWSALWAPPKLVTELSVNTDPIQDCNLCSPVPPPFLPDVMDFSTITNPPLISTVGSVTDSEPLLREADELGHLEWQLTERSNQRDRQHECLVHMTTGVNQFFLGNETLRRNLRNTQSRLEDLQKTCKIAKGNHRTLNMLFKIPSRFI